MYIDTRSEHKINLKWLDEMHLRQQQQEAFQDVARFLSRRKGPRAFGLFGYAGTGKTTLVQQIIKQLLAKHRFVACVAPTNKAVKVLMRMGQSAGLTGVDYGTLHQLLGLKRVIDEDTGRQRWIEDGRKMAEIRYDAIFVDEASMVGAELYEFLTRALSKRCKLVIVGDPAQLPPVGETSSPCFVVDPQLTLTEIIRHGGAIQAYVNELRDHQAGGLLPPPRNDHDAIEGCWSLPRIEWLERLIADFRSPEFAADNDHVRALAWTNAVVDWGNDRIHRAIYGDDADPYIPGQRLVARDFVMEDDEIQLANASEVIIQKATRTRLEGFNAWLLDVETDDERDITLRVLDTTSTRSFDEHLDRLRRRAYTATSGLAKKTAWREFWRWHRYFAAMRPIYWQTTHTAQGSTFSRAYIALGDILRNPDPQERSRCLYTACTRAAHQLVIANDSPITGLH